MGDLKHHGGIKTVEPPRKSQPGAGKLLQIGSMSLHPPEAVTRVLSYSAAMALPSPAKGRTPRAGPAGRPVRGSLQGFTLLELMIVASIISILTVVAIPTFQQARDAAVIGTQVAQLQAFAKACAQINSTGFGTTPVLPPVSAERGGLEITQGCTRENEGATLLASWGTARASGIACFSTRSQISSRQARITVTPVGVQNCAYED